MATYAIAIFEYKAMDNGDLTFVEGDIIEVLTQNGEWWQGKTRDGRQGFFPFNRVEILKGRPAGMGGGVDKLNNLKVRDAVETVGKVSVELKDVGSGTKRGLAVFTVRLATPGSPVIGEKNMHDFRRLDRALRMLAPDYTFTCTLSPEWADEIPLSPDQARERADLLNKYLAHNTSGRELLDVLILTWLKNSKEQIRNARPNENVRVLPSDNRQAVNQKIASALSAAYGKGLEGDPAKWFVGPSKTGDLAQTMFDWNARDGTELSLVRGDYVLVGSKSTRYDGWWFGQKIDGAKGLFPRNYIQELNESEIRQRFKAKPGTVGTRGTNNGAGAMVKQKTFGATSNNTGFQKPNNTGGFQGFNNNPPKNQPFTQPNNRQDVPVVSPVAMTSNMPARDRKTETAFAVKSVEAYEELRTQGFTIEQNGRYLKANKAGGPQRGDLVSLSYNAYVWDPQSQQLREFSSSDRLKEPPRGVTTGDAGNNGVPMEFVVGNDTAIAGLESVVLNLKPNTPVRVVISPSKGYGDVGSPPEIPGNCYLVYDLTLNKVSKGGSFKPPRNQIFSVGISRPAVQMRQPSKRGEGFTNANPWNAGSAKTGGGFGGPTWSKGY